MDTVVIDECSRLAPILLILRGKGAYYRMVQTLIRYWNLIFGTYALAASVKATTLANEAVSPSPMLALPF